MVIRSTSSSDPSLSSFLVVVGALTCRAFFFALQTVATRGDFVRAFGRAMRRQVPAQAGGALGPSAAGSSGGGDSGGGGGGTGGDEAPFWEAVALAAEDEAAGARHAPLALIEAIVPQQVRQGLVEGCEEGRGKVGGGEQQAFFITLERTCTAAKNGKLRGGGGMRAPLAVAFDLLPRCCLVLTVPRPTRKRQ